MQAIHIKMFKVNGFRIPRWLIVLIIQISKKMAHILVSYIKGMLFWIFCKPEIQIQIAPGKFKEVPKHDLWPPRFY